MWISTKFHKCFNDGISTLDWFDLYFLININRSKMSFSTTISTTWVWQQEAFGLKSGINSMTKSQLVNEHIHNHLTFFVWLRKVTFQLKVAKYWFVVNWKLYMTRFSLFTIPKNNNVFDKVFTKSCNANWIVFWLQKRDYFYFSVIITSDWPITWPSKKSWVVFKNNDKYFQL